MQTIYIPAGPKNLKNGLFTSINFADVEDYYLELLDAGGNVLATTTKYFPKVCSDDSIRIHFLNGLGAIDAVTFKLTSVDGDIKSEQWQRSASIEFQRDRHAVSRFNVQSNKTYTAKTVDYPETAMPWLEELFRSPLAWLEWSGASEGEPDSYLPIVITDSKFPQQKEEERYTYEVTLQFRLSNENVNIRN